MCIYTKKSMTFRTKNLSQSKVFFVFKARQTFIKLKQVLVLSISE